MATPFGKLIQTIKEVPIEQVALLRDDVIDMEERRGQAWGYCPNHPDKVKTNFIVGNDYNRCHCFVCNFDEDGIGLIQHIDDVGFKDAVTKIAVELKIITEEEKENIFKRDKEVRMKKGHLKKAEIKTKKRKPLTDKVANIRHEVYSSFAKGESIINPMIDNDTITPKALLSIDYSVVDTTKDNRFKKLSGEHYRHLKEERMLTDEEIERYGFFTLPRFKPATIGLYHDLQKKGVDFNHLNQVPGFYRLDNDLRMKYFEDTDTFNTFPKKEEVKHGKGEYIWQYDNIQGLGIPIKDAEGRIVAIQVRADEEDGAKYIWFSSSFTAKRDDLAGGSSPGPQMDVTRPNNWTNHTVFITEGKFKAIQLANQFDSPVISVQGVNATKGVDEYVKKIEEKYKRVVKHVVVVFDADMASNPAVMKATVSVGNKLKDFDVYVAVWDEKFGKGVDDMLLEGHRDKLSRLSLEQLKVIQEKMSQKYPLPNWNGKGDKLEHDKKVEKIKKSRMKYFYTLFLRLDFPIHEDTETLTVVEKETI